MSRPWVGHAAWLLMEGQMEGLSLKKMLGRFAGEVFGRTRHVGNLDMDCLEALRDGAAQTVLGDLRHGCLRV